jgi:hypothetical protein
LAGVSLCYDCKREIVSRKTEVKLPESLKQWLGPALGALVLGAIGYFLGQIVHDVSDPFLKHIVPALSVSVLLWICCLLLLIIVLLICWIWYLHRVHREPSKAEIAKRFDAQFEDAIDPATGLWKHRTKSGYFCPNCKAWGRESQIITNKGRVWFCPVLDCKFEILNPEIYGAGQKPPQLAPGELG